MTRKFDLMMIHRHSRGHNNNNTNSNNSNNSSSGMGSVTIRCISLLFLWCALTTMMMSSSSFVQSQFTPETTITWSSCATVESWVKSSRYASSTNSIIVANRETREEMGTTMMMENELENRMEALHVHQQTTNQQKQSNNDDGKHLVDCSAMRLPLIWDSTSDKRNVHFFVQRVQCGSKVSPRLVSWCCCIYMLLYVEYCSRHFERAVWCYSSAWTWNSLILRAFVKWSSLAIERLWLNNNRRVKSGCSTVRRDRGKVNRCTLGPTSSATVYRATICWFPITEASESRHFWPASAPRRISAINIRPVSNIWRMRVHWARTTVCRALVRRMHPVSLCTLPPSITLVSSRRIRMHNSICTVSTMVPCGWIECCKWTKLSPSVNKSWSTRSLSTRHWVSTRVHWVLTRSTNDTLQHGTNCWTIA